MQLNRRFTRPVLGKHENAVKILIDVLDVYMLLLLGMHSHNQIGVKISLQCI